MKRIDPRLVGVGLMCALATACGSADDPSTQVSAADPTASTVVRLATSALASTTAAGETGADLGVDAPVAGDHTFCGAIGSVPAAWLNDALVPLQVWIDTFDPVTDAPGDAAPALDRLKEFAAARMRWQLGSEPDRPPFDAGLLADLQLVADVAVVACPELPVVVAAAEQTPPDWEGEISERCAADATRLAEAIAVYEAARGVPPQHAIQLDAVLFATGANPLIGDVIHIGSEYHGVGDDATPVAAPGGPCDL